MVFRGYNAFFKTDCMTFNFYLDLLFRQPYRLMIINHICEFPLDALHRSCFVGDTLFLLFTLLEHAHKLFFL